MPTKAALVAQRVNQLSADVGAAFINVAADPQAAVVLTEKFVNARRDLEKATARAEAERAAADERIELANTVHHEASTKLAEINSRETALANRERQAAADRQELAAVRKELDKQLEALEAERADITAAYLNRLERAVRGMS